MSKLNGTSNSAHIYTAELEGFTGLPVNEETIAATWKDWRGSQPNGAGWDLYDAPLILPEHTIKANGKKIEMS